MSSFNLVDEVRIGPFPQQHRQQFVVAVPHGPVEDSVTVGDVRHIEGTTAVQEHLRCLLVVEFHSPGEETLNGIDVDSPIKLS